MAVKGRLSASHGELFTYGAYLLGGVEPVRDFDRSTVDRFVQQVDKETGLPLWEAVAHDADPDARKANRQVTVKIAAEVQPVPPEAIPGTPFRPVEFEGLTVTPYIDDKACRGPANGERHRCRARIAYSFRATGMHAPTRGARPAGSDGKSVA